MGQWSQHTYSERKEKNLPILEFNFIFPKINLLTGSEERNRSPIRVSALHGGNDFIASVLTEILRFIGKNNNEDDIQSDTFFYGILGGRSYREQRLGIGSDFMPEIKFSREHGVNVLIDPAGTDPYFDTHNDIVRRKWMTMAQLHRSFPETKRFGDINSFFDIPVGEQTTGLEIGSFYKNGTDVGINFALHHDDKKRLIQTIEFFEKIPRREWALVQTTENDMKIIELPEHMQKEAVVKRIEANVNGITAISRETDDMKKTIVAGRWILDQVTNPNGYNKISIKPFMPFHTDSGDDGTIRSDLARVQTPGVARYLIDPQREMNFNRSISAEILGRSLLKGGLIDKSLGLTAGQIKKIKEGEFVGIDLPPGKLMKDVVHEFSKDAPAALQAYALYADKNEEMIKAISMAIDPLAGIASGSKESGIAAQTRIRQGSTALSRMMSRMNRCRADAYEQALFYVREHYPPEKVAKIVGSMDSAGIIFQNQNQVVPAEEVMEALQSDDLQKYFVQIESGDNTPSARQSYVVQLLDMVAVAPDYAPILIKHAIAKSDLPDKDEIVAEIEALTGLISEQQRIEGQAA